MRLTEVLKLALTAGVFLTVFALALRTRKADMLFLVRQWRLGLLAMAAMYLVVPLVAVLIARAFHLKPAVEIALIALAFSPVPPLLPGKQVRAGGEPSYVTSLLVVASVVSLIVTPAGMQLTGRLFSLDVQIAPAAIAKLLLISIGAPLLAGLVTGKLLGSRAEALSSVLTKIANALLLASVLVLLVVMLPAMGKLVGDGTLIALAGMIVAGLAAGYWMGGAQPEHKTALSLAAATRHPGIAIAIATTNFPQETLAPAAIILYALLNALIGIPYLRRLNRVAATPA